MNETSTSEPTKSMGSMDRVIDRRGLVRGAALTMAGFAAASLLFPGMAEAQSTGGIPSSIPGTGDIQVLNYALQLEDLEADLYNQALLRLTAGGTDAKASSSVGTITGLGLSSSDPVVAYLTKFAAVETAHRNFLASALGNSAITVTNPVKYDFGVQGMTRQQVLDLVLEAEATGVQAYLGAIPLFTKASQYLPTAAAIQGTEARHTSVLTALRNLLSSQGAVSDPIAPVAPLKGDSGVQPTAASYSSATPNTGTPEGRDLVMAPTDVLTRVSGFIKTS